MQHQPQPKFPQLKRLRARLGPLPVGQEPSDMVTFIRLHCFGQLPIPLLFGDFMNGIESALSPFGISLPAGQDFRPLHLEMLQIQEK